MCTTASVNNNVLEVITKFISARKSFTSNDIWDIIIEKYPNTKKDYVSKEVSKAYSQCKFPNGYICVKMYKDDISFKLYTYDIQYDININDKLFKTHKEPSKEEKAIRCVIEYISAFPEIKNINELIEKIKAKFK